MLINKNVLKPDTIVSVRLVSGDEVVGRLMACETGDIRLARPITAVMQPTGRGDIALSFAPFMATANDLEEVTLPITSVLCRPVPTQDNIAQGYKQATSPILQPDKGLLLPK